MHSAECRRQNTKQTCRRPRFLLLPPGFRGLCKPVDHLWCGWRTADHVCSMQTCCRHTLCRSQDSLGLYQTAAHAAERDLPAARAALEDVVRGLNQAIGQGEALARRLQGLRMGLGHLAVGLGCSLPQHRMLHDCFRIRSPEAFDRELLPALDVILGVL